MMPSPRKNFGYWQAFSREPDEKWEGWQLGQKQGGRVGSAVTLATDDSNVTRAGAVTRQMVGLGICFEGSADRVC